MNNVILNIIMILTNNQRFTHIKKTRKTYIDVTLNIIIITIEVGSGVVTDDVKGHGKEQESKK